MSYHVSSVLSLYQDAVTFLNIGTRQGQKRLVPGTEWNLLGAELVVRSVNIHGRVTMGILNNSSDF